MDEVLSYEFLNSKFEQGRSDLGDSLQERYYERRIERCLSWIKQAEQIRDYNVDAAFIFWWIAFNALYGYEDASPEATKDWKRQRIFFKRLLRYDEGRVFEKVQEIFDDSISFIRNRWVFSLFWKARNDQYKNEPSFEDSSSYAGWSSYTNWPSNFSDKKKKFKFDFNDQKAGEVLQSIFSSLYTLRNQIIHGGATWDSHRNRDTVTGGEKILGHLVPAMALIVINNPGIDLGKPPYFAEYK